MPGFFVGGRADSVERAGNRAEGGSGSSIPTRAMAPWPKKEGQGVNPVPLAK